MKGWKTMFFNALSFLVALTEWPKLVEYVDPQIILLVVTLANMILRKYTDTPVGKKE